MFQPTYHNVKIRQFKEEESKNGIIIPDAFRKFQNVGEIVAVGEGTPDKPMLRKVGETVLFPVRNYHETEEGGERFILINQFDIIAVKE